MVLSLFVTFAAFAQTSGSTGALRGTVTDSSGAPLPGVTVTLTSPQLQGTRVGVTDEQGQYLFPLLPPGTYRAEYALSGVRSATREGVAVNVQRTSEVNVPMQLSVSETVVVTASQVVVDPTQTQQQQTFSEDHLKYAAVGSTNRSYQNILQQAAGVAGGANPAVSGSNLAQNDWLVDGVNTTDPVTHTFGPNLAFDSIQEISIVTLGKDAEYGSSGGTINVITKSGGNRFSGSFDMRYNDPDFLEEGQEARGDRGAPGTTNLLRFDKSTQTFKSVQPQATLGGPVLRDRLWFFASTVKPLTQQTAANIRGFQPGVREFKGWNTMAKLTLTPIANQTMAVRFLDSHANITNANFSGLYSPEADALQTQHTRTYAASYDAVLSSSWLANVQLGHTPGALSVEPMSGDFSTPGRFNNDNSVRTVNYTNWQYRTSTRDEVILSTTYYLEGLLGRHAFKGGINIDETDFSSYNNAVGDPTRLPGWDPALCSPAFGFPSGVQCAATITDQPVSATRPVARMFITLSVVNPEHSVDGSGQAFYIQDEWNPIPRLTARLGLRYDRIQFGVEGNEVPEFDLVQPRVGVAYDIFNNANSVVHAFGGKVMDDNQLTLPNFGVAEPQISRLFLYNPTTNTYAPAGNPSGGLTGGLYDPNLQPSFSNQYSVGFTQRVFRNTSVDITGEYRTQKNLFEDYCNTPDGSCIVTNTPGGQNVLRSDYRAITTKIESRPTTNLDLVASWTHGRARGSTESTQNQDTSFDYDPEHFVNTYGYLSTDARDRVKLNGFYRLPWQFILGASYYWDSGTPWNVFQTGAAVPNVGYGTYFLEPRGSRRLPHLSQLDVQLQKNFTVGPVTAGLIGSVFNVTNKETGTAVSGNVGSNPALPTASFGTYTSYQRPRRYEVGVRFEF
ncbi:MAG TPA: TonB-dependent receptor [Thermoanaerobaculia bacterium]